MKIVVLASGAGRTLQNILDEQRRLAVRWQIVGVISDNPQAGVLERAKAAQLPVQIVSPKDFQNFSSWDLALRAAIDNSGADIAFLFGFLRRLGVGALGGCQGRIFNVHPSLLPHYGGKGMYGRRVHEAVIAAREKQTGVTIHRVNANYDEGAILQQALLTVLPDETAAGLEERVKALEIKTILEFLNSQVD